MKFLIPLALFSSVALARAMPHKRSALAQPAAMPDVLDLLARKDDDKDKNKQKGKDKTKSEDGPHSTTSALSALPTKGEDKTKSDDGPHGTTTAPPALPTHHDDDDRTKTVTVTITVTISGNKTITAPSNGTGPLPTGDVVTPSLIEVLTGVNTLPTGPTINDLQAPVQTAA